MLRVLLPALALLSLSACSGTRPATEPAPPETVSYPGEPASAPVEEPTPAPAYEPAPSPVYEPTPTPATSRQVQGFRVQIYASDSPAGGEQARSDAQNWWAAEQRRSGFTAPLDAYVVALDGLYKVRMGAFTNRADAESALQLVRTRFPDAFLVPDLVTIDG
ncbi:MAG TPA: SPOR domain-containing protein [Rubricoccaceae bacterium]|jgi:cell division septation protein DedD